MAAVFFAGFFPLNVLAELTNIMALAYLMLVSLGLLKLRKMFGKTKSWRIQSAIRSAIANRLHLDLYCIDASSANCDMDRVRYRNGYWTDHLFWLWLWTQQDE